MHLSPGNLYGGFCPGDFHAPPEITISIYPARPFGSGYSRLRGRLEGLGLSIAPGNKTTP
jgi:hypothetical protein